MYAVVLTAGTFTHAGDFETAFRTEVSGFLNGLDKTKSDACLQPLAGKQRWQMQYTGGKRPGIRISQLNAVQRASLEKALRLVLSPYGWKMAHEVARQDAKKGEDPLGKYWITCFGDARKGDFAFRLAEHHLTIVHLEVVKGETREFGPILLGANPPRLWKADEQALLSAWQDADNTKLLIKDKMAVATEAMPEGEGVLFTELNVRAQTAVKAAWQLRLNLFTAPVRARINKLHTQHGGWEKSRVSFYHEVPTKRSIDGGRWDFKCGLPGMVWDYQSSTGHIHMSLWAK
ncbi:MAG: DUF3500 domain-containing protein [Akkermansiaceae bacterium]|nr:DUF3500 domain-containing protein [Akkermansiaceae bacterium]